MQPTPPVSWRAAAGALADLIPRARLDRSVLAWADAAAPTRWEVAFSGGADSLALLLLVWAHWPGRRRHLRALHFDHRLRGTASRADALFCRRVCRALGIGCEVGIWSRPRSAPPPSEAEARVARMSFFHRHGRVLWLGQHLDDVAETLLMRLARGSGAGGLSAPRPVQPMPGGRWHLRPLLGLHKAAIVRALQAAGVSWRHDATNDEPDFFRNRIRHRVIPAWVAAAGRDAIAGAGRSRELLAEDEAALDAWVDRLAPIATSGDLLLSRLQGVPRAVGRRSLHRWLLQLRPEIEVSRQAFDALLDAVERGAPTRHSIGQNVFAVLRQGRVRCEVGKPRNKFQRRVN